MWHGHFATSHTKVDDVRLMHRQNELFRARGLGDFRELLHAVATDPAMLLWLDGDRNRAEMEDYMARRAALDATVERGAGMGMGMGGRPVEGGDPNFTPLRR